MSTNLSRNTRKMESEDNDNSSSLVPAKRQKCSTAAKTIADLPDEVLEKILELAIGAEKSAGFLNASFVCKKWNQIISESPRIMSILSQIVRLRRSVGGLNVEEFKITRKYREFTMRTFLTYAEQKGKIFPTHPDVIMSTISTCLTGSLLSLKLKNLKLDPSYFSAMSSLKLLKRLSISHCTAKPVKMDPISFELDYLKMKNSSDCILDGMNCKKLKTFRYHADGFSRENPGESTIKFLNRLEELNELIFIAPSWKSYLPELKPKFLWKKLKCQIAFNTDFISNVAESNMIALAQASTEDGEAHIISYPDWLNDSLYSSDFTIDFLNNCEKIKTLELVGDEGDKSIKADLSTLRVMHEVQTLYELECNFKDAEGLSGLKSLLDKIPNLKNLTLNLCDKDINYDEQMNDPINIQLKNLEILTIRPKTFFDSTAMFWRIFSFGSSLKQLEVSPFFNSLNCYVTNKKVDEERSPIRLYKDWLSAENRSSVESCILKLTRYSFDPSYDMEKTRNNVELEVFGRLLNADEKKFFSEIIIDDWKV